jgi:PAS domain S-box-containing protein
MSTAPPTRPTRGFALRDRLLLFTLGIVVVLLGLSLGIIDAFVRRQVTRLVTEELVTTGAVFTSFMEQRSLWLRAQSRVVAEDPRFSATLDLPGADPASRTRTVTPQAKRFQNILGSDLFLVTDASGLSMARLLVERPTRIAERRPVQEGSDTELWTVARRLFLTITRPVTAADEVVGWISVGVGYGPDVELPSGAALSDMATADALADRLHERDTDRIDDIAWELQQLFQADLVAVLDSDRQILKLVVCETTSGDDLSALPSVAAALGGEESEGLRSVDRRLFHTVGVPVWSPDGLVGTLTTGFEIDDVLAEDLRSTTHSHITFFDSRNRLVASTWDAESGRRPELEDRVRRLGVGEGPFEVVVGDERFLTLAGRFGASNAATYLIQRSLDEAFEFLDVLEELLLLVGVGVLALAAALSFAGARRITRPVQALVEGTRRLGAGQLGHRIVETSRSELGELAHSFNDMAATLSSSREALEESERAYRDLFDNAQDLVFTTDLEHRIETVNKAGLIYLGYGANELQGRSLYELVDEAGRSRLQALEVGVLPGDPRPPLETGLRRADGQTATFEIVSRWIVEAGQPVGIHAIGRDITQRREREQATIRFREQLAQAEKLRALGEMAAGVAHNFNNLLTVVVGNAELISLHQDIPEPIRKDTERILDSARRCSAIVRRIQTFGRPIDMADTDLVDLGEVARETVDITHPKWKTEPELAGRTVRMALDLQPVPTILSQGSAWEEILSNLIFNAVDAMPTGGVISISTRAEDGWVVVRVADDGDGMDEETQRRIFEPFYTTKQEEAGTGLGLSTVWGLVQTLGGDVGVDSILGEGTTFTIRMPVAEPQDREETALDEGPTTTEPLRILVVDDEPRVLELLPPILSGHDVDTANGGGAGLERVGAADYDVVLTDWVMAEASGLEVAGAAKERDPRTVVVLMTGWERTDSQANSDAVDLRLSKPFERDDVERVMEEAVRLLQERAAVP